MWRPDCGLKSCIQDRRHQLGVRDKTSEHKRTTKFEADRRATHCRSRKCNQCPGNEWWINFHCCQTPIEHDAVTVAEDNTYRHTRAITGANDDNVWMHTISQQHLLIQVPQFLYQPWCCKFSHVSHQDREMGDILRLADAKDSMIWQELSACGLLECGGIRGDTVMRL